MIFVTGVVITCSCSSSANADSSVEISRSVYGMLFCERNSFTLRQNSQPGCAYRTTCLGILSDCLRVAAGAAAAVADDRHRTVRHRCVLLHRASEYRESVATRLESPARQS